APAGEQLAVGVTYSVRWSASDDVLLTGFDVSLSLDGGASFTPLPGCSGLPAGARTCTWTVPSPATSQGLVLVLAHDSAGKTGQAAGAFTSGAAALTVTRPNTALAFDAGSVEAITWTHNLGSGIPVDVALSRDGGATWGLLAHVPNATATTGSYGWTVTGPPTSRGRIRVTYAGTPLVQDQSDVDFTVRTAAVAAVLARDIVPGPAASSPGGLTAFGDALLFSASQPATGNELWRTDGSAAGTLLVKDVNPGTAGGVGAIRAAAGQIFFVGYRPDTGTELWRSDGTEAGTALVTEIAAGTSSSFIEGLTASGGYVYFKACPVPTATDCEPWRSDGTAAGTIEQKDTNPSASATPAGFVALDGIALSTAPDGAQTSLWRSDGTPDGTTRLTPSTIGVSSAQPPTRAGSRVFFTAGDSAT